VSLLSSYLFRQKWDGEVSAYSVFNEGQKAIPGTFTADQFDKQLRGTSNWEDDNDAAASSGVGDAKKTPRIQLESLTAVEKVRRREAALAAAEKRMGGTSN
jgi:hypothetical protein